MNAATQDEMHHRLASRLRFRHLQLLLAVQRGGSLRAAAQAMNLTQPALSKALGEIEAGFGFRLFDRSARGLVPTDRGKAALRGATLLLEELAHVQQEVASSEVAMMTLRVGAPPFVAHGYLPPVLAWLVRRDPPVRVSLLEERVPPLLAALAEGRVDALVSSYPAQLPQDLDVQLRFHKLFDTEYTLVAPPAHPLARRRRRLEWAELARLAWIMPARSSMVRRVIEEGFVRAGVAPPAPLVESTNPVTNLQLVAAGIGWSVVPGPAARRATDQGLVVPVRVDPPLTPGPVALIWRVGAESERLDLLRAALRHADRAPGRA